MLGVYDTPPLPPDRVVVAISQIQDQIARIYKRDDEGCYQNGSQDPF